MTTTDSKQHLKAHSSFVSILRSEWIKIRSVRSTTWTLIAMIVLSVGIGALGTFAIASNWTQVPAARRVGFDPTSRSLAGLMLGQLALGVLGIIVFSAEITTGTIRSTFAAVPSRPTVLAAKAVVFGVVALVVSEVVAFASFFVGQAILSGTTPTATLGQPGVLRAVVGSGLYLTVLGLFALGIGVIIRHSAGAIAAFVAIVLILPLLVAPLPASISNDINRFLPFTIGQTMMQITPQPNAFSPWVGLLVALGYATVLLIIGGWSLVKRDA
ncbi:MAG: ABC transporter permease subunit [Ferrimicrobium sp.]